MDHDWILKSKKAWQEAEAILIGAGAGMGVDSGLPDFRGNSGFWKAYPPLEKLGIQFHEMANPLWFEDDPNLAWGFYGHRFDLYQKTKPHHGFEILLEKNARQGVPMFIFTSNVDGHFQKTGFNEDQIVECHGSIVHLQCTRACGQSIWRIDSSSIPSIDQESLRAVGPMPLCPNCGSVARPNILMFSDWGWIQERTAKQRENLNKWLDQHNSSKLLVLEFGAGKSIPTVRMTCEEIARSNKGELIRVNLREADSSSVEIIPIELTAKEAIQIMSEI